MGNISRMDSLRFSRDLVLQNLKHIHFLLIVLIFDVLASLVHEPCAMSLEPRARNHQACIKGIKGGVGWDGVGWCGVGDAVGAVGRE